MERKTRETKKPRNCNRINSGLILFRGVWGKGTPLFSIRPKIEKGGGGKKNLLKWL